MAETDGMDALERLVDAAPGVGSISSGAGGDTLEGGAWSPQGAVTLSAPNFLSLVDRRRFYMALTVIGAAALALGFLLTLALHADASSNWMLPTNLLMGFGMLSLLLAYFTVGGFGQVSVSVGEGAKNAADAKTMEIEVTPKDKAIDVALDTAVTATFSEAVAKASVTKTSFLLKKADVAVDADVDYVEATKVATLKPKAALEAKTEYTATLTTDVKDGAGSGLKAAKSWTFTTK